MYDVEVMCTFSKDGSIVPLQIKLEDEEQQRHIFKIKRYKAPNVHLKTESGYLDSFTYADILDFECFIQVLNKEKLVTLRYFLKEHKWILLVK